MLKNNKEGKTVKDIKEVVKIIIISALLILTITAFFWMPLMELKNSSNYEVFKPGRMERTEVLIAYKLDFYRLFFTLKNDYMVYDIGIITLFGLFLTPLTLKKIKKERYYRLYLFMLVSGIVSVIMTLKIFPFEHLPATLKMLQFSFRMLEFSSFFFAFVAGINIVIASKRFEKREIIVILVILMTLSTFYVNKIRIKENYYEQRLIDTVAVTEKTGRVHAGCASFEYLPSKAFENRKYIETRNKDILVLGEEGVLELPYIYYPGYKVTVDEDGKTTTFDTFETENGFVGIMAHDTEIEKIKVEYTGTTIMRISKVISIIGCFIYVYIIIREMIEKSRIK